MKSILVAEDDPAIREGLRDALEAEGYTVSVARNGAEALGAYRSASFDLLLLDVMMPKLSGYDLCREVRKSNARVPILFLTAKGEEIDKVVGLELGADDYITKPFGLRELLARVAAALRRAAASSGDPGGIPEAPLDFAGGRLDPDLREWSIGGRSVPFTELEYKLAAVFAGHPERALARDYLLDRVWGTGYAGTTRALDQLVLQIRKKIEARPGDPVHIITVHGRGYRYHP